MIGAEEFDMSRTFAISLIAAAALTVAGGHAQKASPLATLKTTAESSDFKSTSTYEDVVKFMKAVADAAPTVVHYTTYGMTNENRAMPMAVVGTGLKDISPAAVRATLKLRVHIQGNIHAGEVEGKESAQILLRELAEGKHNDWLQSTIFLITPIFNADGNEKFSLTNRSRQNGPINGMGTRANAQGLNINRDFMKLETPEARAFVKLWIDYDPHVGFDLHTSDGAATGYYLTYAPPLNPDTSEAIVSLMKSEWFPFVTKNIKSKYGWDTFYYGTAGGGGRGRGGAPGGPGGGGAGRAGATAGTGAGAAGAGAASGAGAGGAAAAQTAAGRAGQGPPMPDVVGATPQPGVTRSWSTFEHVARFHNNYVGMRNRFALLSEAYAYATFEDRIKATNYFMDEALTFAHQNAARLKKICADADKESIIGKMEGTRAQMKNGGTIEVLMGELEDEKNPNNGASMSRRKDVVHPEQMTDMLWFSASKTEEAPVAYYVPAEATKAVELLKLHGIVMRQLTRPVSGVERFGIDGMTAAPGGNPQDLGQHVGKMVRLEGIWAPAPDTSAPAGAWEVPMNQPLARLAFDLLAPTSDDGLTAWNFLDDLLKDAKTYPILRKK
jgi:hypothetical protein